MFSQVFTTLCATIIQLFNLVSRLIKGTDNLADSYCILTEVAQTNSQRILDESKAINVMRKAELDQKIQAKFKSESSNWQI